MVCERESARARVGEREMKRRGGGGGSACASGGSTHAYAGSVVRVQGWGLILI